MVSTVIHAVGPNYSLIEGIRFEISNFYYFYYLFFLTHINNNNSYGNGEDVEEALARGDILLSNAYRSCMNAAQERNIELLGFSLLSAGAFRGSRNLEDILRIAINSISSGVYEGLREVHLVAYTQEEISTILHVLDGQSGPIPSSILIGSGSADAIRFFMNNLEKSVTS